MILLVFNPSGKIPLDRLKLKIWERGILISLAMVLSNLIEISSMSRLVLGCRSFKVFMMVSGLIRESSKFGGFCVVMNDSGSVLVGWVEFEISSPIPAKKSLNVFAISVGFVKVLLLN